jgi:metallo-beta-lactamase class B
MRLRWLANPGAAVLLLLLTAGCAMVDHLTGEDVNRAVRERGLPALATVLEIRDTGVKVNDDPVVGFRLEVHAEGLPPWQAETRCVVSPLAIPQIQPGAVLAVRYDPLDHARVAIALGDEPPAGPAPAATAAGPSGLGDDLTVEQLAAGVWLHTSWIDLETYGKTPANGLVVVSGDEAALVDTAWTDDQTRRLIAWVAEHERARVSTVVVTHSHRDRLGGLAAAHAAGARSFGLDRTAELARANGAVVPQVRFTDRLTVQLGDRILELRYLGPGHTEDNIVVWLPDVALLFGGCLVRPGNGTSLGNTSEADLERWPATIEAVEREYGSARFVVPGHGAPGGPELLAHTLELLRHAP